MKWLILLLVSCPAWAQTSRQAIQSACIAMNQAHGAYRCAITYNRDVGSAMIIDKVKPQHMAEDREVFRLRDSFFDAGGVIFEVHSGRPKFNQCDSGGCQMVDEKFSMRKAPRE